MLFVENAPLHEHSTMRLGGVAQYLCTIKTEEDLIEAMDFAHGHDLDVRMIGVGSNIIWSDLGYKGLVIVNEIHKFDISDNVVTIGSGVNWDDAVERTVEAGLSGIEFLSLIPGTAGATPVQNVGAYGTEIKDVLVKLRAYDRSVNKFVELKNKDCDFRYRTSRFKTVDAGRFMITEITLALSSENPKPPFYESLQTYLDDNDITNYSPENIRKAVVDIRQSKLPDPEKIANNGSFFANPIISINEYENLLEKFPDIKAWSYDGKMKIAAGWLVEQAGFKDSHDRTTGMATWKNQSLVLVNENAKSTLDLINFRDNIIMAVEKTFGITLEQEPELL